MTPTHSYSVGTTILVEIVASSVLLWYTFDFYSISSIRGNITIHRYLRAIVVLIPAGILMGTMFFFIGRYTGVGMGVLYDGKEPLNPRLLGPWLHGDVRGDRDRYYPGPGSALARREEGECLDDREMEGQPRPTTTVRCSIGISSSTATPTTAGTTWIL